MQPSSDKQYRSQCRAERLIALGRIVLSAFSLLAIWLDPSEPARYAGFTYGILTSYLCYSLLLGRLTWRNDFVRGRLLIATHCIDLLVFAVLMFLTEGPGSPFFVYFIFLIVCATFRWQWRGTLATALTAMAFMIALALCPANLLQNQGIELNRFVIRVVYLAVVATLLGYFGSYEQSTRRVLTMLAQWPRPLSRQLEPRVSELLGYAAAVLNAPRLVLIWEEEEEPWLHWASWSRDGFSYRREHPATFCPLVAEELAGSSFFCEDASLCSPEVVIGSATGLIRRELPPLTQELHKLLVPGPMVASRLHGEHNEGYLFVLDRPRLTVDDLVLGEIVAHELAAQLDHSVLLTQLKVSAATEERIRLARNLHDGLLQSLAGAALQLETVQRQMESDPKLARQTVQEVQRLLQSEQHDLRVEITELRPFVPERPGEGSTLNERLEELRQRIMQQWDLEVSVTSTSPVTHVSRSMSREIYFVVHEALINAARHADATSLTAHLSYRPGQVLITMVDNGHGFSFTGRYDHHELFQLKRGPVTLKERIAVLGGTLTINSGPEGARLEIALPLAEHGG